MKRANNIFDRIYAIKNLELAFYKAAKGKRQQKEVLLFEAHLNENLHLIQQEIKTGTADFTIYSFFKIYDPKERVISVAPFKIRVLHHAIINICHPFFENQQIYHSYATRVEKGTHKALKEVVSNNKQNNWFLKLDVKKFFDTINHQALKELLEKTFKEKKLLQLFGTIVDGYGNKQGVPIGNLTSQYFANFYLSYLDRFAKQTLKIKGYIRYMDDIILWGRTKAQIWYYYGQLKAFLETHLKQTFKPVIFNKTSYPFNYLGYIIEKEVLKPNKRNRIKFIKKQRQILHLLKINKITEQKAQQQFWSMHQYHTFLINTYANNASWRQLEQ
jgi:retron-type reverse transcriptase